MLSAHQYECIVITTLTEIFGHSTRDSCPNCPTLPGTPLWERSTHVGIRYVIRLKFWPIMSAHFSL